MFGSVNRKELHLINLIIKRPLIIHNRNRRLAVDWANSMLAKQNKKNQFKSSLIFKKMEIQAHESRILSS